MKGLSTKELEKFDALDDGHFPTKQQIAYLSSSTMIRSNHRSRFQIILLAMTLLVSVHLWAQQSTSEDADDQGQSHLMVVGDFNHDGIADIAKVKSASNSSARSYLTVMLGQAGGTFREAASKPMLGHNPKSLAIGDFNNDGIPDLLAGDEDGSVTLLIGDGTGNMTPADQIAHLDSVVSIAAADFNHDGILDIAVSDWRASSVVMLLGDGHGGFRHTWSFSMRMRGTNPHLATADFNGDGIPDLAVVYDNDDGDTYDVMLGNGDGTFTPAPGLSLVKDPNSHCVT